MRISDWSSDVCSSDLCLASTGYAVWVFSGYRRRLSHGRDSAPPPGVSDERWITSPGSACWSAILRSFQKSNDGRVGVDKRSGRSSNDGMAARFVRENSVAAHAMGQE